MSALRPLVVCACVLAGAAPLLEAQCPDGTPPPCQAQRRAPAPNSVAVLFFRSLSPDTTDVFLADGLTDELITRLSQVRRLEVKSRFESDRARALRTADPRAIGATLGAAYLVTGSLQKSGQRERVNVALVRTQTGTQVWGEVYERAGDILAIQADITREVASAITGRLLPQERATLARLPTRDPVAYDLYLRGVGAANTLSEAGIRAGLDYLDRAIARDPAFVDAYLQKALAWTMLADGYEEGRVALARVRESAERALRLDSTRAVGYSLLAAAATQIDADSALATRLAVRAVLLDPRSSFTHVAFTWALLCFGRMDDSTAAEARRGWEADTLSVEAAVNNLWTLNMLGRFDAFAAVLPRVENVFLPEDMREFDGVVQLAHGDPAAAAERLSWSYYGGLFSAEYVRAQLALGRREVAQAAVDSMVEASRHGFYNAFGIARAYAALGDADEAFAWLDRSWAQRSGWLMALRHYPDFAPLHADPRWAALLRRMGLQP